MAVDCDQPTQLSGLTQAAVIQATGDAIVPYSTGTEIGQQLLDDDVPLWFGEIDPAAGQPTTSMNWHSSTAGHDAGLGALNYFVHGYRTATGLTATHITATLG